MFFSSLRRKKVLVGMSFVSMAVLIFPASKVFADDAGLASILAAIKQDTGNILQTVNTLPSHIDAIATTLTQFAVQWVGPDSSKETAALQSNFALLSNVNAEIDQTITMLQPTLVKDFITSNGITATNTPNANDLLYQSLLKQPYFSPDPRGNNTSSAYSYIRNASGIAMVHTLPQLSTWHGAQADQLRYQNYFNTIMSIQSFNGYILSQMYADLQSQKDGTLSELQASLRSQASNSGWFALVSSENIGLVLRQILMYNSQTFVLMTQLLQTQKQALATQAMTNTLLIVGNQFTENQLLMRAIQK